MADEHRVTIRLPAELSTALAPLVRQGHTVSALVRDALEAYIHSCLTPSDILSPRPIAVSDRLSDSTSDTTSDELAVLTTHLMTLMADVAALRQQLSQLTQRIEALAALSDVSDILSDTPSDASDSPAYDPTRYRLGSLCTRRHEYAQSGQTLRRIPNGACPQCETEAQRERRHARRQGAP